MSVLALEEYAVDGIVPREVLTPQSAEEIAEVFKTGQAIIPRGGGTMMSLGNIPRAADVVVCTTELKRVLEYEPADLVVTVQAGVRVAELQRLLGEHGQCLPLDPPL